MSRILLKLKKMGFWIVCLILVIVIVSLTRGLVGLLGTKERFSDAQMEVERLEEEREALESHYVYESQEYVAEKQLRDALGLSQEGEVVVVLPDELVDKTIEEKNMVEEEGMEELPNWKKWVRVFFN